jgi:small-conductance mechanosensitive channel
MPGSGVGWLRQAQVPVSPETIGETTLDPWSVLWALVVVLAAWLISRSTRRLIRRALQNVEGMSLDVKELAGRIAGYVVLFLGFGVALSIVGIPVQPLLAVILIIGAILALALRGVAENFAAGIILQTRHPIRVGDEVESLDYNGIVEAIDSRTVIVDTFDGRRVFLPNSEVLSNPLLNHSALGRRRSELELRVKTGNFRSVPDRLREVLAEVDGVIADPSPAVFLRAVDPGRVTVLVRFWHQPGEAAQVLSRAIEAIGDEYPEGSAVITPPPVAPLTPPAAI